MDNFDDYFDGPDIEDKEEPKKENESGPSSQPDPGNVEQKPKRYRKLIIISLSLLFAAIIIWGYLRYFNPYIIDAQKTGYILDVEQRGVIFKTYEGSMLSEYAIQDTSKLYQRDFSFSFENDSLAKEAMNLQGSGKKVTLKYKMYDGVLPWRGNSKYVITDIEL